jgi:hypothetical protein
MLWRLVQRQIGKVCGFAPTSSAASPSGIQEVWANAHRLYSRIAVSMCIGAPM